MSKMSKAIAVLGVVAGLGVAALPMSTYAALPTGDNVYKTAASAQVEVEVEGAVSIATNADTIGTNGVISLGKIMPGSITEDMTAPLEVTVSSNSAANFDLYINTLEDDGALTGDNSGAKIKGGIPAAGTAAWGYRYAAASDGLTGAFQAVPAGAANATKLNSDKLATAGEGDTKTNTSYFDFKASTATTTTADTYRGTVVFTAVVEN